MGTNDELREQIKLNKELLKDLNRQTGFYNEIKGASLEKRRGLEEELKQTKALIDELEKMKIAGDLTAEQEKSLSLLKQQREQQKELNAEYRKTFTIAGRITNEFATQRTLSIEFARTQAAIYNYSEKIAHEYRDIAREVGLTRDQAHGVGVAFRAALPEVLAMGGEMSDITNLYTKFSEQSGRLTFFNEEDIITMDALSRATKMMPSEVAGIAETFDLMGVGVQSMNETLVDVYDASQKAGLNSTKVIKTLQSNIKQMSSFSFVNGVRGMTEMARQAVKMRLDVSDVLSMADKFYQPEAAIEAAANLQMLGGDIAKAFGDPFETMYLARNKPEELAKKLQDMTENMLQFNAESGEFELPAEARMQLKSAGDQLGINVDKMTEMARQSSKIGKVKMEIDGNAFDDEVREGIAGMAKMKDGKWVVDFASPSGEKMEIDINNTEQLREAVDQGLLDTQKSDTDLFRDISMNTQTMSERMTSMGEATRATVVEGTDFHKLYEDAMGPTLEAMEKQTMRTVSAIMEKNNPNVTANKGLNELQKWATGLSVMDPNNLNINFGNLNVPPAPDGANPLNLGNGAITPAQIEAMNNHTSNYTGTMSVSVNVTGDANSAIDKQFLTNTIASVVRKQISNGLEVVTDGTNIEVVLKE
jgi:hypothetical protein